MVELIPEEKQKFPQIDTKGGSFGEIKLLVLFLLLLIISIIGYFISDNQWLDYTFAHMGGLCIVGLLGCCAGFIARKKGYGFWKAFLLGFSLPIFLGFIAAFITQPIACGGTVSLAVALLILIIYSFVKRRMVLS